VYELQDAAPAERRGLLRVLLAWLGSVPTDPAGHDRLLQHTVGRGGNDASIMTHPGGSAPTYAAVRIADSSGALGAIFAALCCAGTPFIVAGLGAGGLGFLKNDAILWPLMFLSLAVALWGFWMGRRIHGLSGPLVIAAVGALALIAGVVFIHGFPAIQVIWSGVGALLSATVWNVSARRRRAAPSQ